MFPGISGPPIMDINCTWTVIQETALLSYIPSEWHLLEAFCSLLRREALTGPEYKILHTQQHEPHALGPRSTPCKISTATRLPCYRTEPSPGKAYCRRRWPPLFQPPSSPPLHFCPTSALADKKAPGSPCFGSSGMFKSHKPWARHKETPTLAPSLNHDKLLSQSLLPAFSCHF